MTTRWSPFVSGAAVAALVAACSASGRLTDSHPLEAGELRTVMRSFDRTVRDQVPAETDQYDRWAGVYSNIADVAAELERSAVALSGRPPDGLELTERGRFQVLGRSLASAASSLREAAARSDPDAVSLARTRVGLACRDCHARFRPDTPGVPDAFR